MKRGRSSVINEYENVGLPNNSATRIASNSPSVKQMPFDGIVVRVANFSLSTVECGRAQKVVLALTPASLDQNAFSCA